MDFKLAEEIMNNSNNPSHRTLVSRVIEFEAETELGIFDIYKNANYDFVLHLNLGENSYNLFFSNNKIQIIRIEDKKAFISNVYELAVDLGCIEEKNDFFKILHVFDYIFWSKKYYTITRNELMVKMMSNRNNNDKKYFSRKEPKKNNTYNNKNTKKTVYSNKPTISVYTYIVKDSRSNIYKIGQTSNLKQRINSIKTSNIYIEFIGCVNKDIELELHNKYSNSRILETREWFKLSKSQIDSIITNYGFSSSIPK